MLAFFLFFLLFFIYFFPPCIYSDDSIPCNIFVLMNECMDMNEFIHIVMFISFEWHLRDFYLQLAV